MITLGRWRREPEALPLTGARPAGGSLLLPPILILIALMLAAVAYIVYVLWPRWPAPPVALAEVHLEPSALPAGLRD